MSRFWDLAVGFLALLSPPVRMWQQLFGHLASLEHFSPGVALAVSSSVATQEPLVSHVRLSVA